MLLIFVLFASVVNAENLLDSLKSESSKTSAEFTQRKYIEAFDDVVISKGRMNVLKNGFTIEYTEPFRYSLSYDGAVIKNTNHDMGTETVVKVKDNPVMMVVMNYFNQIINMQFDQLDKDFVIKEREQTLLLTPRNETLEKYIRNIEIDFENRLIKSVIIHSMGKEYTAFEIQEMK